MVCAVLSLGVCVQASGLFFGLSVSVVYCLCFCCLDLGFDFLPCDSCVVWCGVWLCGYL